VEFILHASLGKFIYHAVGLSKQKGIS
jgi:hypothetical protein